MSGGIDDIGGADEIGGADDCGGADRVGTPVITPFRPLGKKRPLPDKLPAVTMATTCKLYTLFMFTKANCLQ